MARNSLSGLHQFVIGFEQKPFYAGIDMYKLCYHLGQRRADGRAPGLVTPASPQSVVALLNGMHIRIGAVADESGPTGFSLARMLQDSDIPVIVAAPIDILLVPSGR